MSVGAGVKRFCAAGGAILQRQCIKIGCLSGVRFVSQSVSTIRARSQVALVGRAAFNLFSSFVVLLVDCVTGSRVIHLPVFGKHSRANKALGSDALTRAGQLKR